MRHIQFGIFILLLISLPFYGANSFSLKKSLIGTVSIEGKVHNGKYLYVTAGSSLYSIGNQAGGFPSVGFHVPGEMGGIWMHPIKLFDGFEVSINGQNLDTCSRFISYPYANQFVYQYDRSLSVTRTDFVTDSLPVMIVEYVIHNTDAKPRHMDWSMIFHSDLRPVWLGERSGMIDAQDALMKKQAQGFILHDIKNSWYSGVRVENLSGFTLQDQIKEGNKANITLLNRIDVAAHGDVVFRFYLSGSMKSDADVEHQLDVVKNHIAEFVAKKQLRYRTIDHCAELSVPDTLLAKAYRWGKYSTDWLTRQDANAKMWLSAGLPDYPWLFSNDQSTAFSALVGTIHPQLFYDSWAKLRDLSNAYNHDSGRIVHEASSNGQVYDKGRMEESQEFINAAWSIFKWTGNKDFLRTYYDQGKKIYDFLMENDKNHNLYVEGYGGVEIEGLNDEMLDVACHTQAFLSSMSQMARIFGDNELSSMYQNKADQLKQKINADWWDADNHCYFDFISTKDKALKIIDMALDKRVQSGRNEWAGNYLKKLKQSVADGSYTKNGYTVFFNPSTVVLNTQVADSSKAIDYLNHVPYFCNKYGLYISGIARPDDITLEEGSVVDRLKGDFNYNNAVMVVATSGLATAACQYGHSDAALPFMQRILNSFSFATPGTTYEVSPDYGMFAQGWNVSGLNVPLIHYFFGISPMAFEKTVVLSPDMPSKWNEASLKNVLIGDNHLSMVFHRTATGRQVYQITSSRPDWKLKFKVPKQEIYVNGKKQNQPSSGYILMTGKNNTIAY